MSESVVVAGPYPTMGGPESAATFATVRALVGAGHDVLVVSPRPSAAHHVADPGSPRGAAKLSGLVAGRDRLVLRLDATALAAGSDSPRLLPARLALAAAMRRAAAVDLLLDRVPGNVAPRWVRLVVGRAATVTVASEDERAALVSAGASGDRIVVDPSITPVASRHPTAPNRRETAPPAAEASAEAIEELIRRRAAEAEPPSPASGDAVSASKPLRAVVPLERPRIRSTNPGYAAVKRVQLKLLAWMLDAVIQHVNRLHHATIEAVELAAAERSRPAD